MSKDEQRQRRRMRAEHAEPVERNNPVPWLLGLVAACSLCLGRQLLPAQPGPRTRHSRRPAARRGHHAAGRGARCRGWRADFCQPLCVLSSSDGSRTARRIPAAGRFRMGEWRREHGRPHPASRNQRDDHGQGRDIQRPHAGVRHQLSDAEIAAVASYVRASFGNKSPAVTADVVKAERAKLGNRSTPWAGGAELQAQQ